MPEYPIRSGLDKQEEGRQGPGEGQAPLLVLCIVAGLLVLTGFFIQGDAAAASGKVIRLVATASTSDDPVTTTTTDTIETSATVPAPLFHPIRHPSWLVIPSLGVSAPVVSVGLLENGDMETPHTGNVGWYSLGPAPGEQGPAVMVAHVDNRSSPDVFYHLKEIRIGAEIIVHGADGDAAVFAVDSVEQQLKIDLPRDRIWTYPATALIRLITCGGEWDSSSKHYLSNVIVYGHLVR